MAAGHTRCYDCTRKKLFPTCSQDCKEIIQTGLLTFAISDYINLNDDDWCVSYCLQQCCGLQLFRVKKLTSVCNLSQSLDNIALDDACDMLEEECSELNLSL